MESRGTILVVDDDPGIAGVIRETLTEEGYRVLIAPTIEEALQIIRAFRLGLILTDPFHPTSGDPADNWTRLHSLAHAAHDTPLVLCSAHDPATYTDLPAHGFAAFLPKPFALDDLLAVAAMTLPTVVKS